jgi:hypothetical protein
MTSPPRWGLALLTPPERLIRAVGSTLDALMNKSALISVFASLSSLFVAAGCDGTSERMCQMSAEPQPASGFCAPARIASGMPLRLQIREQCGGCIKQATRCEVAVSGSSIKLRLLGQTCTLPPDVNCPAICSVSAFDCAVPPLVAGTYRVSAEAGVPDEVMMVAESTTTTTSCTAMP